MAQTYSKEHVAVDEMTLTPAAEEAVSPPRLISVADAARKYDIPKGVLERLVKKASNSSQETPFSCSLPGRRSI